MAGWRVINRLPSIIAVGQKKLGLWRGRFLSLGGRLTLMNSYLTNVPLYKLSIYSAPKSVIRRIDIHRKNLLWQSGRDCKKIHLANWEMVCTPKMQGGLGVLDLNCMNDALLAKWLWNIENSNGLWQEIIRAKYINVSHPDFRGPKPGCEHNHQVCWDQVSHI
jgi:hypothetical protein